MRNKELNGSSRQQLLVNAASTHLSNHFHCRKREKYMDSW